MITDPWFYVAAVPAVFILGLSKGGFTALGLLMVPIMALANIAHTGGGHHAPHPRPQRHRRRDLLLGRL
ncbi:MAG: hypothetical protein WDN31_16885 [Hyphomicrobium sp.]